MISFNAPHASGTQIQRTANLTGASYPVLSFTYAPPTWWRATRSWSRPAAAPPGPSRPWRPSPGALPRSRLRTPRTLPTSRPPRPSASESPGALPRPARRSPSTTWTSRAGVQHLRVRQPARVPVELDGLPHPAGRHSRHADLQRHGRRPLAVGMTAITNTASTTSAQFPIAMSASVTNIVVNPSVLSASVGRQGLAGRRRRRQPGHRRAGHRQRRGDAQGPVGHAGGRHDHRRERPLPLPRRDGPAPATTSR